MWIGEFQSLVVGRRRVWQCKVVFCRPEISNVNLIFILFSFVLFCVQVFMFLKAPAMFVQVVNSR